MAHDRRESSMVGLSLLLALGCILVGIGLVLPRPQSPIAYYTPDEHHYTFILSNETPAFKLDFSPLASIEIVRLTTNSTAVALLALTDSVAFLNCTNVTSISQVTARISGETLEWESIRIEVCRIDSDALVDLEMFEWNWVLAFVDYPAWAFFAPNAVAVLGALLIVYSLWRLGSIEPRPLKEARGVAQIRTGRTPITQAVAALLVVLGGLLSVPITRGALLNEYAIVSLVENVSSGHLSYRLNESAPFGTLELADLCPISETNYTIEVRVTVSHGFPVIVSFNSALGRDEFVLEYPSDSGRWLLKFIARAEESQQVEFEKPAGTADVDCQYVVERSITGPRTSPIPAAVAGSVGGLLIIFGLILARRWDKQFRAAESQQKTDLGFPSPLGLITTTR